MRVVVVEPAEPVIDTEEAKEHLRVDHGDDDQLIDAYIAAATGHIDGPDGWLGRAIGVQTLELRTEVFRDAMVLPYPPAIDVIDVRHLDGDGVERTVLPSEYELRGPLIGSAFGRRWPSVGRDAEAVRIRYRAGYEDLPPAIRVAILMMVADLYKFRESVTGASAAAKVVIPTAVEMLLLPFRVYT